MHLVKMILVFAPWLAFLFIAQGSLFRLKLGLAVGLVLCIVMGIARIHRGIILWSGILFFLYTTVAVLLYENTWTIHYMGVLASGFLAASTWLGVVIGKPFTLDYAREDVDPIFWNDPRFIRSNSIVTSAWGFVFTLNSVLAWCKTQSFPIDDLVYEGISYTMLIGTVSFTAWHTKRARAQRVSGKIHRMPV